MKNIYSLFIIISLVLTLFSACSDDQSSIIPTNVTTLLTQAREGAVMLKWDIPADSNYLYVQIDYQNKRTEERFIENVSIYADTFLVKNLLAKDGIYDFKIKSISHTGDASPVLVEASCQALPVQPITDKFMEKVDLTAEMLSTNAQEPNEGPIANLVDGKNDNFFHTAWSTGKEGPHWFDIALPETMENIELTLYYRGGNTGNAVKDITVLGSIDAKEWEEIITLEDTGEGKTKYVSPTILLAKEYMHIRYRADQTHSGNAYFAYAELVLNKVWYDIYDPESN